MPLLPDRVSIDHLKKQAKDLLRSYRASETAAIDRMSRALPALAGLDHAAVVARDLRLHDAQSAIAREYGFSSWSDLRLFVDLQPLTLTARDRASAWLALVYAGDVTGTLAPARPHVAARLLAQQPKLASGDESIICAVGGESRMRELIAADSAWVHRPSGPFTLPPLVAVTHSALLQLGEFRDGLHRCAALLLASGADPNSKIANRYPPASLLQPNESEPLSALYGAAGQNKDPALTKLLLEAGADPNDGESLYHSLENLDCTRLLLERGALIEGTNAIYRALDLERADAIILLLQHGADPNERSTRPPLDEWGAPLLWAIRRRRSRRHVEALLDAGADPAATTRDGTSAYRLAMQFGLSEIAELLMRQTGPEELSIVDSFVAACARADVTASGALVAQQPDLPRMLNDKQISVLPEMAADGNDVAVRLMVELGWPISARGGDWDASALNHAVFRGNAPLVRFLLEHGASWRERHGYGDDGLGTLSWASCNQPNSDGDWAGCAAALLDHGIPKAEPSEADWVRIDGRRIRFSENVTEVLLSGG